VSRYHSGRALEYEVMAIWRNAGWSVTRGSSSKGEVAGLKTDLIASKMGRDKRTVYFVVMQAKRRKS